MFIEKCKLMFAKLGGILYTKYKIISLILLIIIIATGGTLIAKSITSKAATDNGVCNYNVFSSNIVSQSDPKIIENSDFNGVFVYGPYINLKAGKYKGVINYNSTVSVKYELTSSFGTSMIASGELTAGKTFTEFNFTIPQDITDKSVELRIYYNGTGRLEFTSFEYKSLVVGHNYVVPFIALLLCFICSIFRLSGKKGYLTELYLILFYILGINYLAKNVLMTVIVGVIQLGFIILLSCINKITDNISLLKAKDYFAAFVSAFLLVSSYFIKVLKPGDNITFLGNMDKDMYWLLLAMLLSLIFVLGVVSKKIIYIITLLSSVVFALLMIKCYNNIYVAIGVVLILGYFNYLILEQDDLGFNSLNDRFNDYKSSFFVVLIGAVIACAIMTIQGICRYKIYGASTFDFGIFAQMYEYMAKTGLPLTTCERGYLLSHFYIHFSPIYYLFLPVYMIFRTPVTLIAIQAVLVFGAVIPLFLICKKYGLKPLITILICFIYILSPSIQRPLLYDFHENAFVPFFVFWFIYFFEIKKFKPSVVFLVLSLMIKEDTSLYMIAICIFYVFRKGYLKNSLIMLAITLCYFAAAMTFISINGLGLMEGHYGLYYLGGEKGLMPIVRNIWYAPGFFVKNVFAEDNFKYIIYTIGSLLFVPLMTKDFKRLVLILPFIAFGLMTNYAYQHDIGFQYTYGLMTCMFLLFVVNVKDFQPKKQSFVVITSLCAVLVFYGQYMGKSTDSYDKMYHNNQAVYDEMDSFLEEIPKETSVSADTFLTPHLYYVDELYELATKADTEYYVLQKTSQDQNSIDFMNNYKEKGYKIFAENNKIIIYKK